MHFNIEIKAKYWWMKAGNWQMILLIIIAILLFYDFGCHIRERMRSKAELAARPQKVN